MVCVSLSSYEGPSLSSVSRLLNCSFQNSCFPPSLPSPANELALSHSLYVMVCVDTSYL